MTNQILTAEKRPSVFVSSRGFKSGFGRIFSTLIKYHEVPHRHIPPLHSLCASCCLQFLFSGQKLTVTLTLGHIRERFEVWWWPRRHTLMDHWLVIQRFDIEDDVHVVFADNVLMYWSLTFKTQTLNVWTVCATHHWSVGRSNLQVALSNWWWPVIPSLGWNSWCSECPTTSFERYPPWN